MGAGSSRSSSSAGGKARAGLFAGAPGSRREGKHLRGGPRPGLRAARSHLRSEAPLSKPESLFRSRGAPAGTQSSPPETPSRGSAQALCQLSQVEPSLLAALFASFAALPARLPAAGAPAAASRSTCLFFGLRPCLFRQGNITSRTARGGGGPGGTAPACPGPAAATWAG